MVHGAYGTFGHRAVTPLVQTDANDFLLELYWGPTLAFKDVALQLLGRLFEHAMKNRGETLTIVGATSGDTGSAAIEGVRGRDNMRITILHPHGRVSDVQRRQMTTVLDANVQNLAVDGTFDDCQALVKAMFADAPFRDEMHLSAVNSINWARILPQAVYYFAAGLALGAPDRPVSFTVPTGNFGDVFAGYVASRMGLPVERLVVATNQNDILARTLVSGRYETGTVVPSMSPSMDIQVSSNFERLLFDAVGRDAGTVRAAMGSLKQSGAFAIDETAMAFMRTRFCAARVDEDATRATIAGHRDRTGAVVDPHTAVGLAAAQIQRGDPAVPMVVLATAHPAKFPDAVEGAVGHRPALPGRLADLFEREERFAPVANDLAAVEAAIRAGAGGAA
jgi:threonine synthase